MCVIVGYVGQRDAQSILLNGLKRLEYRGYDSAGVVTVDSEVLHLRRSVGKVSGLDSVLATDPVPGHIGLAHTVGQHTVVPLSRTPILTSMPAIKSRSSTTASLRTTVRAGEREKSDAGDTFGYLLVVDLPLPGRKS